MLHAGAVDALVNHLPKHLNLGDKMTQDVQPLTWQKRTNMEEHQQFFGKINEIIDNLAPTVDEAEAAIAQATAAIASANDAMATANAASAATSAAASQAQTAASTVAGYDARLTAVEGEADANTADITALQAADGQNLKINDINDYAVGLTGNQDDIVGRKNFRTSTFLNRNYRTVIESTYVGHGWHKMFRIKQTADTMIHVVGISTGSQVPHNVFFEFVNYTGAYDGATPVAAPVLIELSSDAESMVNVSNFAVVPVSINGALYFDYYINFEIQPYSGLHVAVDMKNRNDGAVTLSDALITYYQDTAEDPTVLSNVVYGVNGKVYSL